jgi:MarR family transcriptional regulator, organic hydroperoxide resistance regulator
MGSTFMTLFTALRRANVAHFDRQLQPFGVRVGQQFILALLWDTEQDLTIGEIATRLGIETPTVTNAVHRMVRQGLVEKYAHPTDGRLVLVRLTAHGWELREMLPPVLAAAEQQLLAGISEVELALLYRLFRQMLENLGEEPPA